MNQLTMNEATIEPQWFAQYMTHVVNNIRNKEGNIRFSYAQLRQSLTAIESGHEDNCDQAVLELFRNVIKVMPPLSDKLTSHLSDRQARVLMLALLNAHMAYHLINPDLIAFIEQSMP